MQQDSSQEFHETFEDQKEPVALNELKNKLATITDKKDKDLITPDLLLNDDFLIHFLRARKSNIKKTVKMILDYLHWKQTINLEYVVNAYKFPDIHKLEYYYPHGFHKATKSGNPIFLQVMGKLNTEELLKIFTIDDLIKRTVQLNERMNRELYPVCSKTFNKYIFGVFNIMDFKGINKSILNKKALTFLKENSKVCQDYYPENLVGCYVINAGMMFRAIYSTCKVFFDAKTKKKIKVFGTDYKNALLEVVESENLPKFFGGSCECPEGCLFSDAGPWKKEGGEKEVLSEEVIKMRKEMNDMLLYGKLQADPEDQIHENAAGVNGDVYN